MTDPMPLTSPSSRYDHASKWVISMISAPMVRSLYPADSATDG